MRRRARVTSWVAESSNSDWERGCVDLEADVVGVTDDDDSELESLVGGSCAGDAGAFGLTRDVRRRERSCWSESSTVRLAINWARRKEERALGD